MLIVCVGNTAVSSGSMFSETYDMIYVAHLCFCRCSYVVILAPWQQEMCEVSMTGSHWQLQMGAIEIDSICWPINCYSAAKQRCVLNVSEDAGLVNPKGSPSWFFTQLQFLTSENSFPFLEKLSLWCCSALCACFQSYFSLKLSYGSGIWLLPALHAHFLFFCLVFKNPLVQINSSSVSKSAVC